MLKDITKEDIKKFTLNRENLEIVQALDLWFQKRSGEGNMHDILCLVHAFSILASMAGRDIVELEMILRSDDKNFYNA